MISIRKKTLEDSIQITPVKNSFFQLSSKVDYGLFLLTELSKNKEQQPVSLRTIAKENNLSFFFLQKVAYDLRKAGVIESLRGKQGGYILTVSPQKLSLKKIIEILEGPIMVMPCIDTHISTCERENSCTMRPGIKILNNILVETFSKMTLQQLLQTS